MLNPLLWILFLGRCRTGDDSAIQADAASAKTVGELTNFIATHEHSSLVDQQGGWNQRDAMNTLRKLDLRAYSYTGSADNA